LPYTFPDGKKDSYVKIFKPEIAYRIQQTTIATLHTETNHISRNEDIMNILLIEDDPEISSMLETFLTTENYIITAAHDGDEALCKFASGSYNLVLLDLMLPKKNGIALCTICLFTECCSFSPSRQSFFPYIPWKKRMWHNAAS